MSLDKTERVSRMSRPTTSGTCYQGTTTLIAGQELKAETSPGGEELLALTCPAGQEWLVSIRFDIVKSNV